MYFLLHHPTGALVLDAEDRTQVMSWSKRQLGFRADLISVLELEDRLTGEWVEKSGTGIKPAKINGCAPRLSFMADSVQRLAGVDHEVIRSIEWYRAAELRNCNSSVH